MGLHSLLSGEALPSEDSRALRRAGFNWLDVDPPFAGGVSTYALGVLEGFASVGNGYRFRPFVTEGNRHLFEQFRHRDEFDFIVVRDRRFSAQGRICWGTSLLRLDGNGELSLLSAEDRP